MLLIKKAAESEEEDEVKDRERSRERGREETDEECAKRRRCFGEEEVEKLFAEDEDDEIDAEDDLEAGEEEVKQKEIRSPGQPTKAEKERHELTHYPFRSWCKHCVRGKGKENPHRRSKVAEGKEDEKEVPEIHIDYCFQSKDDSAKTITTLVMREKAFRKYCKYCFTSERQAGVRSQKDSRKA